MTIHYTDDTVTLHHGDALEILRELPDESVDCCVTSPPYYGLRDYGEPGQYGLEPTPAEYVEVMRQLFSEVRRVLAAAGTLWLNIGDSYAGSWGAQGKTEQGFHRNVIAARATNQSATRTGSIRKGMPAAKNLMGIPWRVAFALQDDGWILRNDIIWAKPNGMPSSVTDRLTTKHEHLFLFAKSPRYWFDLDSIREQYKGDRDLSRRSRSGETNKPNSAATPWPPPVGGKKQEGLTSTRSGNAPVMADGRNPGDVWTVPTQPFPAAHFAVMPAALAERAIQAGCKPGGTVLDPFSGSGTTGLAAGRHGRRYVGIDLNREYLELSLTTRLAQSSLIDDGEPA